MGLRSFVLDALWEGALARVNRERPVVVAITGTIGKTSVKELVAEVLKLTGKPVFKTPGNLNTNSGVPLALLGYIEPPSSALGWLGAALKALTPPKTKGFKAGVRPYFVLEYSSDATGDIPYLVGKIAPDISIVTAITPAHMQGYANFDELRQEKLSIFAGLQPGGLALVNADDPEQSVLPLSPHAAGYTSLRYGLRERNDQSVWATNLALTAQGLACTLHYKKDGKEQSLPLTTQLLSEPQLSGVLAAALVALHQGVELAALKECLESYVLPPGRGRLLQGVRDITIIDETYNASPASVVSALNSLKELGASLKRRRVAVLGRMNELGDTAEQYHLEIAAAAATACDAVVFVGQYADLMREKAVASGMKPESITVFSDTKSVCDKAEQVTRKGDIVLVKGSQNGVRLEQFVKRIMLHPELASKLLVRQTARWK